ncbi:GT2 family glycosyltransferase [Pedobacter sp. UYEF25]
MIGLSVITLVKGRQEALLNLLEGLTRGLTMPDELVIVFMNDDVCALPTTPFKIVTQELADLENIPLAKARNTGARLASFEKLVFLDVDCIPDQELIKNYVALIDNVHLWAGAIRYLENGATKSAQFLDFLIPLSVPDPVRANIQKLPYELFWSLNFGCSKQIFNHIGGFDEGYKGYGAEDTDFAFRAREKKVPLKTTNIIAYHQYHESYDPPINHLKDIVSNANRFYSIWHKWPMHGWLQSFKNMNLIAWKEQVVILRAPSAHEMEQAKIS